MPEKCFYDGDMGQRITIINWPFAHWCFHRNVPTFKINSECMSDWPSSGTSKNETPPILEGISIFELLWLTQSLLHPQLNKLVENENEEDASGNDKESEISQNIVSQNLNKNANKVAKMFVLAFELEKKLFIVLLIFHF